MPQGQCELLKAHIRISRQLQIRLLQRPHREGALGGTLALGCWLLIQQFYFPVGILNQVHLIDIIGCVTATQLVLALPGSTALPQLQHCKCKECAIQKRWSIMYAGCKTVSFTTRTTILHLIIKYISL